MAMVVALAVFTVAMLAIGVFAQQPREQVAGERAQQVRLHHQQPVLSKRPQHGAPVAGVTAELTAGFTVTHLLGS